MSLKEKFTKDGVLLNGFHRVRSKKLSCSGTFKNGKLNGRGKCKLFQTNKRSVITKPNMLEGQWANNALVKGKMVYPYYSKTTKKMQNQVHIGSFKNGKLNGKGIKKWRNATNKGIFKNGKLIEGRLVLPYYSKTTKKMQKQIQIGTFKNEKLNGKCVKKWRNGIYKGFCKNGSFHGKGTYNYKGKIYKGIWSGTAGNQKLNGTRNWDSV
jgi:hypothetical protein